jgi:hypothetical protein
VCEARPDMDVFGLSLMVAIYALALVGAVLLRFGR